ncbi:MAG TPA: sigma-54 dependent transcriptional regulator [Phycisphaerae bacterium]|nr:sigma-54 dependent transcriptional regulator [Phycisphaerae bacterium]HRR86075.1 sigma-54 dependent transcriptional regulator [Phycisphaerae bacterium]
MADILIVDDEENLCYSVQLALHRAGHQCRVSDTMAGALRLCEDRQPDLVLVDVQLPDGNGLDLIHRLREREVDAPVVVITAFGTVSTAVQAMKHGAVDFLQKPLSMEELCLVVDRCLENRAIRTQLDAYRETEKRRFGEFRIVGECPQMKQVLATAKKIARLPGEPGRGLSTILILGETGTGKELVARYIHLHSLRPEQPFVHLNCTAIPEKLAESELFGHERGAYTDAKGAKKGLLEVADKGTLFLDEVGHMPLSSQAKLLVAIETGRFRRLGGLNERVVDARIIAATNTDLESRARAGEFRLDLFYRLNVFCIRLPPLRERGDDVLVLADYFLERFSRKFHKDPIRLSGETREILKRAHWPGNVRELANVLQQAVLLNESGIIEPSALNTRVSDEISPSASRELCFDFKRDDCTLASVEKRLLQAAIAHTNGNISEAARLLGLTRGGLRYRLEKLGLEPGPSAG